MKRNPSIHIRLSELILVLDECSKHNFIGELDNKELAKQMIKLGRKYSVGHRGTLLTADKQIKEVKKLVANLGSDTGLFISLLMTLRKRRVRYMKSKPPNKGTRDYGFIQEAVKDAIEFCNVFGYDKRKGFIRYIEIALDKMANFGYHKLPKLYEGICKYEEADQICKADKEPTWTMETEKTYNQMVFRSTGITQEWEKDPTKRMYFVQVAEYCVSKGIPPDIYLKAQFQYFDSFTGGGYPDPVQLVGDKALKRLASYMAKNKLKLG